MCCLGKYSFVHVFYKHANSAIVNTAPFLNKKPWLSVIVWCPPPLESGKSPLKVDTEAQKNTNMHDSWWNNLKQRKAASSCWVKFESPFQIDPLSFLFQRSNLNQYIPNFQVQSCPPSTNRKKVPWGMQICWWSREPSCCVRKTCLSLQWTKGTKGPNSEQRANHVALPRGIVPRVLLPWQMYNKCQNNVFPVWVLKDVQPKKN